MSRRRIWLVAGGAAAAASTLAAAAWVSAPTPSALDSRIGAQVGPGGKPVSLDRVAPILREAVVATEDERFYQHHGIDLIGVLRALPYDLAHLSFAQGASTITEQLGKVLYLHGNDHTPWRKLEDAALAVKLENRYDKEQILGAYLNTAYFGEGAYGVWAASERYFGLPPGRLDVGQASLLAGLIQAPSAYDPLHHPTTARERQIDVLRSLVRDGFLTRREAEATLARPLALRSGHPLPPVRGVGFAPGPAFVWSQLAAGLALVLLGAVVVFGSRLPRFRPIRGVVAIRLASLALVVFGAAAVARAFRSA
jgi:membrane peptidoglycan carboxypeptidase